MVKSTCLYCRRNRLPFWSVADLFAPAIPIAAAIGRIPCGLDGMDYGTPTVAMPDGALFLIYLVLFSVLRFVLFFVRGNVPIVALGLKNAQWTSLAILAVALPALLAVSAKRQRVSERPA